MGARKEYSFDLKERVVQAVEKGESQALVSRQFGIPYQTVSFWCRAKKNRGTVENKIRTGRPKKTTTKEDKMIIRESTKNPRLTAPQIQKDFNEHRGTNISVSTVKRRLKAGGLIGRRPCKKPLISKKNRMAGSILPKIIYSGLLKNGPKFYGATNLNLIYFHPMELSLFVAQRTRGTMFGTRYPP